MRAAWAPAVALALLARPASAACDRILEAARAEIRDAYRMDVPCRDLEAAAKTLPVTWLSQSQGQWAYAGEQEIRDDLWNRFQIRFSTTVLPLGVVERTSPEGPGVLVVFGLEMPRRSWALLALTQQESMPPPGRAAAVLGEGSTYDWIGVYPRDAQGRPGPERWIKLKSGGGWSAEHPAPAEARACVPCKGWLCPPEPIACFSDFNENTREELLLIDDCHQQACGTRLLEPDATGRYAVLFDEPGVYGRWTRRADGWALVSEPFCSWGELCGSGRTSLGNPNCERPEVYRFDAKAGTWTPDAALREEYYPVQEKTAPQGCEVDAKGALVYTPDGRFVRYLPGAPTAP